MKIIMYAGLICCLVQGHLCTSDQDSMVQHFFNSQHELVEQQGLAKCGYLNNSNFDRRDQGVGEINNDDDGNETQMNPQVSGDLIARCDNRRDIPVYDLFDRNDDDNQVQDIFVGMHEPDNGNVGVVDDIIGHFYGNNQGGNVMSDDQTEDHSGRVVTEFVNILKTRPDFTLNKQDNSDRAQSEVIDRYRSSIEVHYVFNNDNVGVFAKCFQDSNSLATVDNNENSQQNMDQDQKDPLNKQDQQVIIHYDQITGSDVLEEQVQTSSDRGVSEDGDSDVGQGVRHEDASVDSRSDQRLSPISNGEIRAGDTCSSMENEKNNDVVCKKSDRSLLPEPKAKVFCGWC